MILKTRKNFTIFRNPTPATDNEPTWSSATKLPIDYMRIGNENGNSDKLLEMKSGLFEENSKFWIELREKYGLKVWKSENKNSKNEL